MVAVSLKEAGGGPSPPPEEYYWQLPPKQIAHVAALQARSEALWHPFTGLRVPNEVDAEVTDIWSLNVYLPFDNPLLVLSMAVGTYVPVKNAHDPGDSDVTVPPVPSAFTVNVNAPVALG